MLRTLDNDPPFVIVRVGFLLDGLETHGTAGLGGFPLAKTPAGRGVGFSTFGTAEVVPPVVAFYGAVEGGDDHAGVALRSGEEFEVCLESFEGVVEPVLGRREERHLEVRSGRLR